MKALLIALFLAALIEIIGAMPPHGVTNLAVEVTASNVNCETVFSCADCRTSKVCRPTNDGVLVEYKNITCPPERPYCHSSSGTCIQTASLECGEVDTDFPCLEKNQYFPDDDCRKYHYCDEKYQSKRYECSGESVYDADKKKCVAEPNSCGKFECENHALRKVKHSKFPRFFAMCQKKENQNIPLVVGVCPLYYQMDYKTQECIPDCTELGDGNIPDREDPAGYYSCFWTSTPDGKNYVQYTKKICPANQVFDTILLMCVAHN